MVPELSAAGVVERRTSCRRLASVNVSVCVQAAVAVAPVAVAVVLRPLDSRSARLVSAAAGQAQHALGPRADGRGQNVTDLTLCRAGQAEEDPREGAPDALPAAG